MNWMNRWTAAVITAALLINCGDGGGTASVSSSSGTTGPTTEPPPNDQLCKGKQDGFPVCSNDGEPSQCFGEEAVVQQPACSNQQAFCDSGHCSCNADEDVRCNKNTPEVCVHGVDASNTFVPQQPCAPNQQCTPGKKSDGAGCNAIDVCNNPGFFCAPDANTVIHCQPNGSGFYNPVEAFHCKEMGFANGCFNVPGASSAKSLCKNACNVFGVSLDHNLCDPVESRFCAQFVCTPNGKNVEPDHLDCLPPGASCNVDEDCETCSCVNHQCSGDNTIGQCPRAIEAVCKPL